MICFIPLHNSMGCSNSTVYLSFLRSLFVLFDRSLTADPGFLGGGEKFHKICKQL